MTDEERQTLCKILRTMEPWPCKQAADEIEQLEKENKELYRLLEVQEALAQSDVRRAADRGEK